MIKVHPLHPPFEVNMTTYHLSVRKNCFSHSGMETYSSADVNLNDEQDFLLANSLCKDDTNMAGFWQQNIWSIRTNRASDLFFPNLMNLVMKTKEWAADFFVVLAALICDLGFLPVRLLTFLPRVAYLALTTPKEHPLIPYLRDKGLAPRDLEGEKPVEISVNHNGAFSSHLLERDSKVNILVYKQVQRDQVLEMTGNQYTLNLADEETPFPPPLREKNKFHSNGSVFTIDYGASS